jgi:hypothetical protein
MEILRKYKRENLMLLNKCVSYYRTFGQVFRIPANY